MTAASPVATSSPKQAAKGRQRRKIERRAFAKPFSKRPHVINDETMYRTARDPMTLCLLTLCVLPALRPVCELEWVVKTTQSV